jgi:zona occludens toxin
MITLITGSPGSGKTAFAVAELLKVSGRPVYAYNVAELQLPHEPLDDLNEWHTVVPDGALVVADEVQRAWRPRPAGSKVPDAIAALETHRHRGIDFLIITQGPALVDANVRRLVSRHLHLVATWASRWSFEWPECQSDPLSGRSSAIKAAYALPKQAFGKYKSAEIHHKVKRKLPPAVYGLGLAAVVAVGLGWTAWNRVQAHMGEPEPATIQEGFAPDAASPAGLPAGGAVVEGADVIDFAPRVAGRPETAPAYDQLRVVKDFPRIAGCALSESRGCQCYTQQATRYPVPDAVCREIVEGNVFDPYADPVQPAPMPRPAAPAAPSPESIESFTV